MAEITVRTFGKKNSGESYLLPRWLQHSAPNKNLQTVSRIGEEYGSEERWRLEVAETFPQTPAPLKRGKPARMGEEKESIRPREKARAILV